MLYNHDNNEPEDVIGKWENIRIEGSQLLAEADIDQEEPYALSISKKVEKDYIKGASIRFDFNMEDVQLGFPGYEDVPVITKCVISEASICPIPGNSSAIRLFANGEQIKDESQALSLKLSLTNTTKPNMKNLTLIFAALGLSLTDTSSDAHAVEAINALKTERDSIKLKFDALNTKLEAEVDAKCLALAEQGVADKKYGAEKKDHFYKLAKLDFESTKSIIEGMSGHVTIASQLSKDEKEKTNKYEGWDYKKYQKEAPEALLAMKENNKEGYKKLWQEAFPNGTFNG